VSSFAARRGASLAELLASVASAAEERPPEEVAEALTEALRNDDGQAPALRWQALWLLVRTRGAQGRHGDEYTLLAELAELARELALPELRARVCAQLSRCALTLGDTAAAREHAGEAVALAAGLPAGDRVAALQALVSAEAEAGRLAEARGHAEQMCGLTEERGGAAYTKALWATAAVCIRQGAHREARDLLERALHTLDSREDLVLWMRLRLAAASLLLQITPQPTARARALLEETGPALELVGTERHRQEVLAIRAHLAFAEGRPDEARALCAEAERTGALLSFRDHIRLQALRGRLDILDGRTESGVRRMRELAARAQEARNVELAAETWRGLAETLAGLRGREAAT
jgi:tetratricopeptide (TPR) repeat protein